MEKVAIVGMSCLFPGAQGAGDYWRNLLAGRDSRSEGDARDFGAPIERFLADGPAPDKIYSIRGGFVRDFDFDPADLDLAPDVYERLDPVFLWSLHAAREALRDAGMTGRRDQLAESGLILGNYTFPTFASNRIVTPLWHREIAAGLEAAWTLPEGGIGVPSSAADDPANRYVCGMPAATAAGALGLGGSCFSLDAACSSAIYAIDLASAYLRAGRARVMLAGGVCAPDPWLIHLSFSSLGAYPANGVSQPFEAQSQGIVTGQGASVVVLKMLADAQADGDRILAVIDGIGLSNDGAGRHTLAPNPRGQVIAYERAYAEAGIDPADIDYIECHATGTPLGDRTELSSLDTFFTPRGGVPKIGSVKGNVGHLLTVAGMSSLAKVTMAMHEGTVPATIGVSTPQPFPNPAIPTDRIVRDNEPWPSRGGTRRAAISAFGFGGTNAHMVVSHPSAQAVAARPAPRAVPSMAITGMATHFGELETLARFERAIFHGDTAFGKPSARRWRGTPETAPEGEASQGAAPDGAYVDGIDLDPIDYRIPPAELTHFNPQQALILKVADAALRDAGYGRKAPVEPRNVAVLVALELDLTAHLRRARADLPEVLEGYLSSLGLELDAAERDRLFAVCGDALHGVVKSSEILSYIGNISASRISSLWNFTGPSYTVSSDGVGVAYALEAAQLILGEGKAEAVLVAAVDLAAGFEHYRLYGNAGATLGEGAGAVVVTTPDRGRAEGQRVYAAIDAIAVRREHRRDETLFAPRPETIEAALRGMPPADYVELSALGAVEENAAEIAAVARAVPGATVGAVTANIGQPGVATPMAGLIRTALGLWRRYLPATPGWKKADPRYREAMEAGGLTVATDSLPWIGRRDGGPVRAVVSVAGLSGAHAAIGLVEAEAPRPVVAGHEDDVALVLVQGADRATFETDLDRIIAELDGGAAPSALQRSTLSGFDRDRAAYAAVLIGRNVRALLTDARKLKEGLQARFDGGQPFQTPSGSYFTPKPLGKDGKIAFVYPGGFNSYPHLGRSLFRMFPDVLRSFEARLGDPAEALCAEHLYPLRADRIGPKTLMKMEAAMQHDIATMIISGASFALLYTEILRTCLGIEPDGAFGYSLGETSMLFANGAWPVEARSIDRLRTTELFRTRIAGPRAVVREAYGLGPEVPDADVWTSIVLLDDADRVIEAAERRDRVFVTHVNTPREVVVAGVTADVEALVAELGSQTFRSPISHVLHCDLLRRDFDEVAALNDFPSRPPRDGLALFSAVDYQAVRDFTQAHLTRAIADVMCGRVDFRRLVETAYADGYRLFVECGPSATCSRWVSETLGGRPHLSIPVNQRGADDVKTVLALIARLVSHGAPVDLSMWNPPEPPVKPRALVRLAVGGPEIRAHVRQGAPQARPKRREIPPADGPAVSPPVPPLPDADAPAIGPTLDYLFGDAVMTLETEATVVQPASAAADTTVRAAAETTTPAASQGSPRALFVREAIADLASTHRHFLNSQAELARLALKGGGGFTAETAARLAEQAVSRLGAADPADAVSAEIARVLRSVTADIAATSAPATGGSASGDITAAETAKALAKPRAPKAPGVIWDEHDLLAFAAGKVADVFGPDFAAIDEYPVRVRLPSPPYFFVSRVTRLEARPGRYEPCALTTEYDIPHDAWYLVDGQMPPGVAVEAGQSDLLLIAYLGIDQKNRGVRKYRLLDGKLAFVGPLPRAGQTLRFDISITRFVWRGDALLFFFSYEGFVDGKLALKLEEGCAGFFTEAELSAGGGVIVKGEPPRPRELVKPLLRTERRSLDRSDMVALSQGRIADVFGPAWQIPETCRSVRLPPEMLLMVDRVEDLGSWRADGTYTLTAEKDLDPNGWYYTSHFTDDPVLPGSLAAEGATQVLKTYLMASGLHLTFTDPEFEPIPDLKMVIKVRGQITPDIRTIRYEVRLLESGYLPRPFVRADVLIMHGDKPLVQVSNLGLRLQEKAGADIAPRLGDPTYFSGRKTARGEPVLLNELHLAHAAKGDLRTAMGQEFHIYGQHHRAPHIPNGVFQFVDRGVYIRGERGVLKPGAVMETEYDSPPDAWYYAENSYPRMPNAVYLESALQASILLGYYLGPTLRFPDREYSIRNLDGTAEFLADIDTRGKTIRHHETMISNTLMSNSILQAFDFNLTCDGTPIYKGRSSFGYFTAEALANQVGLDNGKTSQFWTETDGAGVPLQTVDLSGEGGRRFFDAPQGRPHYRLAGGRYRLLHTASIAPSGGKHGLGYVQGYRRIEDTDWYFTNHFHRDPVMPGSLGLESILQSIQLFAINAGIGAEFRNPRFGIAVGVPVEWKYRGQILKTDADMYIETHIKEVRREADRIVVIADADLFKGRLRIYATKSMAIAITEAHD